MKYRFGRILITIPYAGGNAYNMEGLARHLTHIDVVALELPGRGRRINEPILNSMEDIVTDLNKKVLPYLQRCREYYIFGHSMGALIGYLLIKRIIKNNWHPPAHFFVSGTGGPSATSEKKSRHLLPSSEFRLMLKELGGTPEEILMDSCLMDFFEPIIRADFAALETFQYEETSPMDIPVTGFFGSDEETTAGEMLLWQKESTLPMQLMELAGNHFFIFNQWQAISRKIMGSVGLL